MYLFQMILKTLTSVRMVLIDRVYSKQFKYLVIRENGVAVDAGTFFKIPSTSYLPNIGSLLFRFGVKQCNLNIHLGTFSQGCLTCGPGRKGRQLEKRLTDLVDKHSTTGGTTLRIDDVDCCN